MLVLIPLLILTLGLSLMYICLPSGHPILESLFATAMATILVFILLFIFRI